MKKLTILILMMFCFTLPAIANAAFNPHQDASFDEGRKENDRKADDRKPDVRKADVRKADDHKPDVRKPDVKSDDRKPDNRRPQGLNLEFRKSGDPGPEGRRPYERRIDMRKSDDRRPDISHDWSHPAYRNDKWQRENHQSYKFLPFQWHENQNRFLSSNDRFERINDREWQDRFPGLHSYRWYDGNRIGFLYLGHRITDAVLFYNDSNELVSVGFMHDGAFIFVRDDNDGYRNQDSFFFSWWSRN